MGPADVASTLREAARALEGVSDTPRLDAELLMAEALGMERGAMLLSARDLDTPPGFAALLERRLAHEPVAYITGRRDFWTISLAVGPGVLIPRADSETLLEVAVEQFGKAGPRTILDLGTGPGTLLLAALAQWPDAQGLGIDSCETALGYAPRNAADLDLEGRARFRLGDWAEGIDGPFDLILCNPPYVESNARLDRQVAGHEPAAALFAGRDGLDDYRRIVPALPRLLAPGGAAILEIGWTQADAVASLAAAAGLSARVAKDLAGRDRALLLKAGTAVHN